MRENMYHSFLILPYHVGSIFFLHPVLSKEEVPTVESKDLKLLRNTDSQAQASLNQYLGFFIIIPGVSYAGSSVVSAKIDWFSVCTSEPPGEL